MANEFPTMNDYAMNLVGGMKKKGMAKGGKMAMKKKGYAAGGVAMKKKMMAGGGMSTSDYDITKAKMPGSAKSTRNVSTKKKVPVVTKFSLPKDIVPLESVIEPFVNDKLPVETVGAVKEVVIDTAFGILKVNLPVALTPEVSAIVADAKWYVGLL